MASAVIRYEPSMVPGLVQQMKQLVRFAQDWRRREQLYRTQAALAFSYWAATYQKRRPLLDVKRERVLVQRLEENRGDLSELLWALDGARRDAYVIGTRTGQRHDQVEWLLRDRSNVEYYAELMAAYRRGETHPMVAKWSDELAQLTDEDGVVVEQLDAQAQLDLLG